MFMRNVGVLSRLACMGARTQLLLLLFFFMGVLWGCFGFLGGAGAPANPSLAPPMVTACPH